MEEPALHRGIHPPGGLERRPVRRARRGGRNGAFLGQVSAASSSNTIDPEMRGRAPGQRTGRVGPEHLVMGAAMPAVCRPVDGHVHRAAAVGAMSGSSSCTATRNIRSGPASGTARQLDSPKTPALATPGAPQIIVIESLLKHAIVISDTPVPAVPAEGGILLKSGLSFVAIDPTGVRVFARLRGIPGDGTR